MKHLFKLLWLAASFPAMAATTVVFQWEQPVEPDWVIGSYELRIATNPAITNPVAVLTVTTNQTTWDIPAIGVRYWANVVAKDTNGIASDPSEAIMFYKPSKPVIKITPKVQTTASIDGPWSDCIQLDPVRLELADKEAFWRMKMGVELVDLVVN